jgi:hypothetical protein
MNRRHVVCGLITILTIAACGGGEVAQESRCAAAPDTLTIASTYSPDLDVSLSQFECNAAGLHWKVRTATWCAFITRDGCPMAPASIAASRAVSRMPSFSDPEL